MIRQEKDDEKAVCAVILSLPTDRKETIGNVGCSRGKKKCVK